MSQVGFETERCNRPVLYRFLPQVDMLSEINIAPRILTNFTGVMPSQFKKDLDSYLKTRSPVTFLSELRSNLQVGLVSVYFKSGVREAQRCDELVAVFCLPGV